MIGLLAGLDDPVLMQRISERSELVGILADRWGITRAEARDWLDAHDAYAIRTAERIKQSEPYTDIPVDHWYH